MIQPVTSTETPLPDTPEEDRRLLKVFAANVRMVRRSQGTSQEKLALRSRVDRSYMGGVENARRNVSLVSVQKIATALNVDPRELLDPELANVPKYKHYSDSALWPRKANTKAD